MSKHHLQRLNIERKDFSKREYYPGTVEHPFNFINRFNAILEKLSVPLYALLFGALVYLVSGNSMKAITIGCFIFTDWLLLSLLPLLRISYGPPALTVVSLGVMRLPFLLFTFPIALSFQVAGTLLVIYGFFIEPQFPRLENYQVNIPSSTRPRSLRIIHLSDLHMTYFSKREEKVVKIVNALQPDLILFTGDFFNLSNQHDPQTVKDIQTFFTRLNAKYGKYGVTGSPAVDLPESISTLPQDLGLTIMKNETLTLEIDDCMLRLIGLECSHRPDDDAARLEHILQASTEEPDASILLYHAPDIAPAITSWPIDLQLSGHTHGGQVQLPILGPVFAGSLYGIKFTSGDYEINQTLRLIISRGLGMEGNAAPRVRFLAPPEIGLITLEIGGDNVK